MMAMEDFRGLPADAELSDPESPEAADNLIWGAKSPFKPLGSPSHLGLQLFTPSVPLSAPVPLAVIRIFGATRLMLP